MQRIAIAIVLSGLLAACGQQSQPAAEGGAPVQLDYIDAVPIDEDAPAPVAQPEAAVRKEEPEEDREPEAEETADVEPARPASPEPTLPAGDAAEATRRANETPATPDVSAAPEPTPRPD